MLHQRAGLAQAGPALLQENLKAPDIRPSPEDATYLA